MPTVISMLRGINVGAHHRVKMQALHDIYRSLALENILTVGQSGNIIFSAPRAKLPALPARIEEAIEAGVGFRPAVILRTAAEISSALAKNPFAQRPGLDPARMLITFLEARPAPHAAAKLAALLHAPLEIRLIARELYVYYPDGISNAKLPVECSDKSLGTRGTARNLNTLQKLLQLAAPLS